MAKRYGAQLLATVHAHTLMQTLQMVACGECSLATNRYRRKPDTSQREDHHATHAHAHKCTPKKRHAALYKELQ